MAGLTVGSHPFFQLGHFWPENERLAPKRLFDRSHDFFMQRLVVCLQIK
jgi:hypothetical protein